MSEITDNAALADAFQQVTAGATMFTRRMAITLADMFDTGPMLMVLRLERQGLLKTGSFDWFKSNGGITRDHVEQVRSEAVAAVRAKQEVA